MSRCYKLYAVRSLSLVISEEANGGNWMNQWTYLVKEKLFKESFLGKYVTSHIYIYIFSLLRSINNFCVTTYELSITINILISKKMYGINIVKDIMMNKYENYNTKATS